MQPFLTTPRIHFFELRKNYEHNMLDLDSDPEVMKYLSNGVPSSPEDIRAAVARTENLLDKHGGRFGLWAAIHKETNEFMGWFLFRPCKKDPENTKRIEIGYRLKKKFWGQGYATEGAKALLEKGFNEYPLDEIFAITVTGNLGSQNVMKKIGLQFVKNFRDETFPEPLNTQVEYSLKKAEWLLRESAYTR